MHYTIVYNIEAESLTEAIKQTKSEKTEPTSTNKREARPTKPAVGPKTPSSP